VDVQGNPNITLDGENGGRGVIGPLGGTSVDIKTLPVSITGKGPSVSFHLP